MVQRLANYPVENLNARELQILSLISEGLTNREIARKLILTTETIKWYNKQIYGKLSVSSRTQAVHRARQFGLLTRDKTAARRPPEIPTNLTQMMTSFVGRENDIKKIKDLMQSARLVTLTGAGGSGKTRLALEVAKELLLSYRDGVWLLELASITDPMQVRDQIALVLKLNPRSEDKTGEIILRYLAKKHILLVIDNFEHLLEAAPFIGDMLVGAPDLHILATSRERLNLYGEYVYPVQPLDLPGHDEEGDMEALRRAGAVELFIQRAQASSSDFTLREGDVRTVARICRRLDGLPLAIELAAARTRLFTPAQLLERLDSRLDLLNSGARNLPARQQTLRQAINWSYELLDEAEERLFICLGSFHGGVAVDVVEAICEISDPVEVLASLLSKSLLYKYEDEAGEARLWMLETIHEFAREKLAGSGLQHRLRERQLDYYVDHVADMKKGYRYKAHEHNLNRTLAEMPNLRAAFDWALTTGQHVKAARLVSDMEYFFRYLHLMAEGYQWVKRVLPFSDLLPDETRVHFLYAAANMAAYNGDLEAGNNLARKALNLAEDIKDEMLAAWCMLEVACSSPYELRDEHFQFIHSALEIFRAEGEISGIAYALNLLGEFYRLDKDFQKAEEIYYEALEVVQETGEVLRESFLTANLAVIAFHRRDAEKSLNLMARAIQLRLDIGQFYYACTGLAFLAGPYCLLGDPEKAARLLGASDAINEMYGAVYQHTDIPDVMEIKALVREELGDGAYEEAVQKGREMTNYEAVRYGLENTS